MKRPSDMPTPRCELGGSDLWSHRLPTRLRGAPTTPYGNISQKEEPNPGHNPLRTKQHLGQNPLNVSGCFEKDGLYVNLIYGFSKYNYIRPNINLSLQWPYSNNHLCVLITVN